MKIELFLKQLKSDNRVMIATKEPYGYVVSLKDGYVFGELNDNTISRTNQKEVLELLNDVVERTNEEVKKIEKIRRIESDISNNENWISWYKADIMAKEKSIKDNYSRIRQYEKSIISYKQRIEEDNEIIKTKKCSILEIEKEILELQKQLEEMKDNN